MLCYNWLEFNLEEVFAKTSKGKKMKRIYLDNAATSFPKAPGIAEEMRRFLEEDCLNPNRTESGRAYELFDQLYSLRCTLAKLYEHNSPESVIFTRSVTESLNWVIKGLFSSSDHIIVTSSEHNAVMRPLVQCKIPFSRIPASREGYSKLECVESLIQPNTKAMIINVCGNVSGHVEDFYALADIARKHDLLLFIDSAQASPYISLSMKELNAAGICFTGHKGFLGPEGVGGMVLRTDIAYAIQPLIIGGTGSESNSEEVPHSLPDRLESGTLNLPGLLGFKKAVDYTIANLDDLRLKIKTNTQRLYDGLEKIKGIEIVGAKLDLQTALTSPKRTGVISIISPNKDIAQISALLLENKGIETRVGLHCSPAAHKTLGTFPNGTLRFSPGPFTTFDEIDNTLDCLMEIMNE